MDVRQPSRACARRTSAKAPLLAALIVPLLGAAVPTSAQDDEPKTVEDVREYFATLPPARALAVAVDTRRSFAWGVGYEQKSEAGAERIALERCAEAARRRGISAPCELVPEEKTGPAAQATAPDDPLGFLAAAQQAGRSRPSRTVRIAIRAANLCATVDFSHIEVDARRGIFDRDREPPVLLYAGDRVYPLDVDLREGGIEVQIDFQTPRLHLGVPSAYLFLPMPLHRRRGQTLHLEHVARALAYIAKPCGGEKSSE